MSFLWLYYEKDSALVDLNEREHGLLISLVERHIADGQPVGSKTLSATERYSPATIRNIMSELEHKGYLNSPHTSAGRVPTDLGYRLFVNSVLQSDSHVAISEKMAQEAQQLQQDLHKNLSHAQLLEQVTNSLSKLTHLAGLVTLPQKRANKLEHIEFLKLSESRLLSVMVMEGEQIQNHVLAVEKDYSESELQQASNYLNANFAGNTLKEIQRLLKTDIESSREAAKAQMALLVNEASRILDVDTDNGSSSSLVVSGETNLMDVTTPDQIDNLKHLFEAFKQKNEFLNLFENCMGSEGVQIYIGKESGHQVLDDYAVVTAPFKSENQVVGVLGVVGPTRMSYKHAISAVDITSKVFASILNSK
jgi:heat-inducible transcriptional repressor